MIFIYNIIFIIFLGFIFKNKINQKKNKIIFLFICFFQMFLIQALRDPSVGTDTKMYIDVYERYQTSEYYGYLYTHYDLGIRFLISVFKNMNLHSQWLLVFMSLLIVLGFSIFIYNNSKNVILSTIIFACILYPNSFNVVRQYIACSIAINCFTLFKNKKNIKGILLFVFAILFHKIVLIMIVPFLLSRIRNINYTYIVLISGLLVIIFCGTSISNYFLTIFRSDFYTSGNYDTNRIFRLTSFLTVFYTFIFLYLSQSEFKCSSYEYRVFICFLVCNIGLGILYLKNEIFSRLIELFNSFLIISIPYAIYLKKDRYSSIYKGITILMAIFLMCNQVFNSKSGIEIYKFFWR